MSAVAIPAYFRSDASAGSFNNWGRLAHLHQPGYGGVLPAGICLCFQHQGGS